MLLERWKALQGGVKCYTEKKVKCKHTGLPGNSDLGILPCHSQPKHLEASKTLHWHSLKIAILKAKMIFEVSKDKKSTGYPAWMEIKRIKRPGPLGLHHQGYEHQSYCLLNLPNLTLHQSIRMWRTQLSGVEKGTKLNGHSLWIPWLLFPALCKQYDRNELGGIPVFGIFFQVSIAPLQFLHSPADAKPMLEGGKAHFHSFIDLSDKNLINLLYKLLKQSKRNELTWYIQHWLLLSKKGMSALSATTAAIQFLRNKLFPSLAPQK